MSGLLVEKPLPTSAARILVVDDEHAVRDVVHRALNRAGYECALAGSTVDAREHLQKYPVDLVTLDVDMPSESGLEFLPQLRRDFPDIAIIMLTAVGKLETAVESLTNGASGFLTKPIDLVDLVDSVKQTLKRRERILHKNRYVRSLEQNLCKQDELAWSSDQQTVRLLVQASLYRDEETGSHVQRVGDSSALLASAMGWSTESCARIRLAAPLHDVGKLGVPDSVLQKPGKLTRDEFQLMKMHVAIGGKLLSGYDSPTLKLASEIALNHHERWDGEGYLNGLRRTLIPQCARIVSVADVFDALTHDRVYRRALPIDEAVGIIRQGRGNQFDPEVVDAFFDILPSILELDRCVHENACSASVSRSRQSPKTGGSVCLGPTSFSQRIKA